jgi:condensin-2 complex subunit G2
VRNQIPGGRRAVLVAYGEVLFRAWRTAAGPCLVELEYGCVQGLMRAALLASTPQVDQYNSKHASCRSTE